MTDKADNDELWEVGPIQEGLGGDWCISTVTLRGGMPPHYYEDEKIHYTVTDGQGIFLVRLRQGSWFAHPANSGHAFAPDNGQAHFFLCLDEKPLVLSVLSSPGVSAKRVCAKYPEAIIIDGTITKVEGGAVMVSTPFGEMPATSTTNETPYVGGQIRCRIALPPISAEDEEPAAPDSD